MSPQERAEARARLDAATPGPWVWKGGYPQRVTSGAGYLLAETWCDPDSPAPEAEFIAHAPTDLSAALDTIDALLPVVEHVARETRRVGGFYGYIQDRPTALALMARRALNGGRDA